MAADAHGVMDKPNIEASELTKHYAGAVALDGLSFTAEAGEILGLLGPNGAGKTTAIRVLTTILAPTGGSFSIAGFPGTRPREIRARIGVLPESAGYPEQQTGEEFLRYHARLFGQRTAAARSVTAALLEQVGLAESASRSIGVYSRGMRQRLGIARALVNDPAVVFLDEPTLGLDPAGQGEILSLIGSLARQRGATVVLSTHFLSEVEGICSRVLILNRGRLVDQGTVAEVTGRVAVPPGGRIRVPTEFRDRAIQLLASLPAVTSVWPIEDQPEWLAVTLVERPGTEGARTGINEAVQVLLSAQIPLLAFEREGARLSDAFLSMTRGD